MAVLNITIETDDTGAVGPVTFEDLGSGTITKFKKFTHPKGSPPPGVPDKDICICIRKFKGPKPTYYCVVDPTTGNLTCILIP